jgi:hypothetical protein
MKIVLPVLGKIVFFDVMISIRLGTSTTMAVFSPEEHFNFPANDI